MDKAYKLLLDQDQKKRILDVIHAGMEYVEHVVSVQTLSYMSFTAPEPFKFPLQRHFSTSVVVLVFSFLFLHLLCTLFTHCNL